MGNAACPRLTGRSWIAPLACVAALAVGCGGDDTATDSGAPPADADIDTGAADTGTRDAVPWTPDTGPERLPLAFALAWEGDRVTGDRIEGAAVYARGADGVLHERTSGPGGEVRFDEIDLAEGRAELTVVAEGAAPFSMVGVGRDTLEFYEARGLGDSGRFTIYFAREGDVQLSGDVNGTDADVLFVQAEDGSPQFAGPPGSWSVTLASRPVAKLVAFAVSRTAGPGPREASWDVDTTTLEVPAQTDAAGLVLDFGADEPTQEVRFSFRVPEGDAFFDEALPVGAGWSSLGGFAATALTAFPTEVRWEPSSRTVAITALQATRANLSVWQARLESSAGASTSVNVHAGETFDADFLRPPALDPSTRDGVSFGDEVRWTADPTETMQSVVYQSAVGPWVVQAWGDAIGRAAPPVLPDPVRDALFAPIGGSAFVITCDLQPAFPMSVTCPRFANSEPFGVAHE